MDTTKLDDLLNEAEAQEEKQIEWLLDQKYDVKDFYVDEHGIVEIKNKTIGDMSKHISVKGESYSQYIEFKINRFYDGIDLVNMLFSIYYDVPNVGSDESKPINVYYNETEIKFGWAIPVEVSQTNLTIDLCIYARGKLSDGNDYVLKTKTATYQINDGLDLGGNTLKPTNNWYLNFVLEMDQKIEQATQSANASTQSANKAEEIEQSISNIYGEVSTMHTEVGSMRDEVERMKDQVEDLTGVGIAAVDKLGVVKPDGETIDIEEDGTLKCIVEVIKDYSSLENKPKINGVELDGDKSFEDLGFEGTTDYQVLENKPSIAGVELSGDKSYDELGIASKKDTEDNFEIVNQNIQELDEYTQILGRDVSNFAGAIQETNLELQTLNERVDSLNQSSTNNFSNIEQRLEELGDDLVDVGNNLSSVDTKVKELETGLEGTSNQLQEVYTTSEENKKEVADVRKELSDTTFKVDTIIKKAELNIKNTASGENIHLTDSADSKAVEFALYGKAKQETTTGAQLLNYDAWKNVGTSAGTSVFENNGITMTSTADDCQTYYGNAIFPEEAKIQVNESDVITLSWEENTNKEGIIFIFGNGITANNVGINNASSKSLTYTVPSGITFITFRFGVRYAGDTISYKNIMINKGSTALPYEPYTGGKPSPSPDYSQEIEVAGSSGSVEVKSVVENLYDVNGENYSFTSEALIDKNDFITIEYDNTQGTSTKYLNLYKKPDFNLKKSIEYLVILEIESNSNCRLVINDKDINDYIGQFETTYQTVSSGVISRVFKTKNDFSNTNIMLRSFVAVDAGVKGFIKFRISIIEDINTNVDSFVYEPYKETSSEIQTPNGLAGIPVDSGGNYTDKNGQQWICDVIVKYADGSGERINKIGKEYLGNLSWIRSTSYNYPFFYSNDMVKKIGSINGLCTHFVNDAKNVTSVTFGANAKDNSFTFVHTNTQILIRCDGYSDTEAFKNAMQGVEVYYELAEPIRTPLTAEQIAEIEKLCTFYPVTNISNDADCGMEITYMADAKNYIDNRLALIETAMLSNI